MTPRIFRFGGKSEIQEEYGPHERHGPDPIRWYSSLRTKSALGEDNRRLRAVRSVPIANSGHFPGGLGSAEGLAAVAFEDRLCWDPLERPGEVRSEAPTPSGAVHRVRFPGHDHLKGQVARGLKTCVHTHARFRSPVHEVFRGYFLCGSRACSSPTLFAGLFGETAPSWSSTCRALFVPFRNLFSRMLVVA